MRIATWAASTFGFLQNIKCVIYRIWKEVIQGRESLGFSDAVCNADYYKCKVEQKLQL